LNFFHFDFLYNLKTFDVGGFLTPYKFYKPVKASGFSSPLEGERAKMF